MSLLFINQLGNVRVEMESVVSKAKYFKDGIPNHKYSSYYTENEINIIAIYCIGGLRLIWFDFEGIGW